MDFCWATMYKAEEAEFVPMLQPEMEWASDFVITCYCVASWRTQNYWRNTQIINKMYFFYKRKWKMFTSTTKYIIYNTVNKISTNVIHSVGNHHQMEFMEIIPDQWKKRNYKNYQVVQIKIMVLQVSGVWDTLIYWYIDVN